MDLQISPRTVDGTPVVALSGIADLGSLPTLQDGLRRAVMQHPGTIVVVEFDGLVAIDDAALGIVLGAAARARDAGGEIEVVCTDRRLRQRLAATRFDLAVAVRSSIV